MRSPGLYLQLHLNTHRNFCILFYRFTKDDLYGLNQRIWLKGAQRKTCLVVTTVGSHMATCAIFPLTNHWQKCSELVSDVKKARHWGETTLTDFMCKSTFSEVQHFSSRSSHNGLTKQISKQSKTWGNLNPEVMCYPRCLCSRLIWAENMNWLQWLN